MKKRSLSTVMSASAGMIMASVLFFFPVLLRAADSQEGSLSAPAAKEGLKSQPQKESSDIFFESSPFEELMRLQKEMSRVFEKNFSDFQKEWKENNQMLHFKMGVAEHPDKIIVTCDIPGLRKEDVRIDVKDNVLTISGARKAESVTKDEKTQYVKKERSFGAFTRSVYLPKGAMIKDVKAAYKDGVLTVTVPREAVKEEVANIPVT
jgi:HSP20 family protein